MSPGSLLAPDPSPFHLLVQLSILLPVTIRFSRDQWLNEEGGDHTGIVVGGGSFVIEGM